MWKGKKVIMDLVKWKKEKRTGELLSPKRSESCGFCSISGHKTKNYAMKKEIRT